MPGQRHLLTHSVIECVTIIHCILIDRGIPNMQIDRSLDLSGLTCPLPILRAKKALAEMATGSILEVIATDPGAPPDFAAFCRQTGHQLIESMTMDEGKFRLILQHK